MNTNPNHNTIRGLQIFINDIRACTTKEAEAKRVESELDKIRKKFSSTKALSGYDKKKYVWKLLYIYILGYKVDFGFNYAADLITSIKMTEKMTGYVSLSVLCRENSQEISIMINSIRNDLLDKNSLPQSLALSLATNLNNSDLLSEIAQDVVKFLTNFNERQPGTVKKAMICLSKILRIKKEIHDAVSWPKYISKMVDIKNFEILMAVANLVLNIFQIVGPAGYEEVAMKFFNNVMYRLKDSPDEYTYYNIRTPWLQIKIMKIMQCINPNLLSQETLKHIKDYIEYIGKKTNEVISHDFKFSRFYSHYCVFFEAVNLIDHMNLKLNAQIFEKFISILGNFLQDNIKKYPNKDVNTKYLALDSLAKLCRYSSKDKIYNDHFNIIVGSIRDNDISIRRRALELLFIVCSQESVKPICKELLIYITEDEPTLKEEVALKIAILAEKYANEYNWYIDIVLKMLEAAGDFVTEDIIFRFAQIVTGFEDQEPNDKIKVYACEKICRMLEKEHVYNSSVKLAAFVLGEYGYMLVQSEGVGHIYNFPKQISLLQKHLMICSNDAIYAVFNAYIKFVKWNPDVRTLVIPVFEQYFESWDTELQQRATEYYILSKLDGEDPNIPNVSEIREKLFEILPPFKKELMNNSILTKRLQSGQVQGLIAQGSDKGAAAAQKESSSVVGSSDSTSPSSPASFNVDNIEKIADILSKTKIEGNPYTDHIIFEKNPNGFAFVMNKYPEEATPINRNLLSQNFDLFKSLLSNATGGIMFNDPNGNYSVDIKVKPADKGVVMAMLTFITNVGKLEEIELHPINNVPGIKLNISKVKYPQDDKSFPQIMLKINMAESFIEPIQVGLRGRIGSMRVESYFALPILMNKFMEPCEMSIENFTALWYEISNSADEKYHKLDSILYNPMQNSPITDFLKKFASLLNSLNFKIYPPSDVNNFHEIEAVSVINGENYSVPVLAQASFVPSHPGEFRFSLRAKVHETDKFYGLLLDVYSIVKFYIHKS